MPGLGTPARSVTVASLCHRGPGEERARGAGEGTHTGPTHRRHKRTRCRPRSAPRRHASEPPRSGWRRGTPRAPPRGRPARRRLSRRGPPVAPLGEASPAPSARRGAAGTRWRAGQGPPLPAGRRKGRAAAAAGSHGPQEEGAGGPRGAAGGHFRRGEAEGVPDRLPQAEGGAEEGGAGGDQAEAEGGAEEDEGGDEADELEHLVTSRTESVNIDHPNHIVTVTTISDLDLSGARQLGLTTPVRENDGSEEKKGEEVVNKPVRTMPKKARNPFLSEKISSLTATLHMHSRKKTKGKRSQCGQGPRKKVQKSSTGRTTKTQRRRLTGKMGRDQD
ncbi:nucleolar protein 12 isoform X1 [Falco peregrinus]|uniref:nucleolar protein 12 isoform X1 n=1 Tax=Falco peregrinus TaxID=8954 RepID=UPI00247A6B73|nr:nucleolar protein 12 isoform X1 [Falco peregrinus]